MADPNWANRTIWTGDNLDVMRGMNSDSVDLIYLDPPFNTNRDYEAPIGSEAAGAAFKDTWTLSDVDEAWHGEVAERQPGVYAACDAAGAIHGLSMKAYLIYMGVRFLEMHRLLKPTGSLYLHCDPTASHYLKMLLDAVFGEANFRNEIVWKRTSHSKGTGDADRTFGAVTDSIFFYTAGESYRLLPRDEDRMPSPPRNGEYDDERGRRYRSGPLDAEGTRDGTSGEPWRDTDPTAIGRHWAIPGRDKMPDWVDLPDEYEDLSSQEKLDALHAAGMIHWPRRRGGKPRFRLYADVDDRLKSLWDDINRAGGAERTGYRTQKPLKLLKRIIRASSNENDVVLDPFCGCATACVAAEDLGRQWIGIDLSEMADQLVRSRFRRELGLTSFTVTHRNDLPQRTDLGQLPSYRTHKHSLYGKQEGHCAGCRTLFPFRNMTIDHIVPRARGGTDHLDNLQLLCNACNSLKGIDSQETFVAELRNRGIRN